MIPEFVDSVVSLPALAVVFLDVHRHCVDYCPMRPHPQTNFGAGDGVVAPQTKVDRLFHDPAPPEITAVEAEDDDLEVPLASWDKRVRCSQNVASTNRPPIDSVNWSIVSSLWER